MLGVDAVQWLVQTGNLSDTMGDDLHRLAAAAERIAEAEEKMLAAYLERTPQGPPQIVNAVDLADAVLRGVRDLQCPRCRGNEAGDADTV